MGLVASLRAVLSLETGPFQKNMALAEVESERLRKSMEKTGRAAGKTGDQAYDAGEKIGKMVRHIAGNVISFQLNDLTNRLKSAVAQGLEYASSLGETSQQLGVSSKAMQEYRYAASQAGVSQDEMDAGLSKLNKTIGEAAMGGKSQAAAFEKLGISIRDANGHVRDAGDVIPEVAQALQRIHSPAERAAVLVELFGKSGQKLAPLLADGAAGVNDLRQAAHQLGLVLSEDQIQRADATADKISALNQALSAHIASTVADNANAILQLANALAIGAGRAAQFASKYTAATSAMGGAIAGGRIGGLPGAIIGTVGGYVGGSMIAQAAEDSNMDIRFRTQKLKVATAQFRRMQAENKNGGGSLFSIRKESGTGVTETGARTEMLKQLGLLKQAMGGSGSASGGSASGLDLPELDLSDHGGGGKGAGSLKRIAGAAAKAVVAIKDLPGPIEQSAAALRLLSAGASEAEAGIGKLSPAVQLTKDQQKLFNDEFTRLTDQLMPEEKALRDYQESLKLIDIALAQHTITVERAADMRLRLAMAGRKDTSVIEDIAANDNLKARVAEAAKSINEFPDILNRTRNSVQDSTVRIAKSFKDMADETLNAINQMVSAIKGGDFLSALSSVLNLGLQLGSIGVFGKGFASTINSIPKHANGTDYAPGGWSLVGEQGPEIVNLPRGSRVWPNGTGPGGGGGNTYVLKGNLMTPEFWNQINAGHAMAAQAGGEIGFSKVQRYGSRRLA